MLFVLQVCPGAALYRVGHDGRIEALFSFLEIARFLAAEASLKRK